MRDEHGDHPQLHLLVEAAPTAIIVVDRRGIIVLSNGEAQLLFGYGPRELAGQNTELLTPERLRAAYQMLRSDYLLAPTSRPMAAGKRLRGLRKDGTEIPLEVGLNPVRVRGELLILAAITDISSRLEAEERFHIAEQMRLVIDGAAQAMIVTDRKGRITLVNSELERIFGYMRQ